MVLSVCLKEPRVQNEDKTSFEQRGRLKKKNAFSTLYYLSAQVSLVWAVEESLGGAVFLEGRERTRLLKFLAHLIRPKANAPGCCVYTAGM